MEVLVAIGVIGLLIAISVPAIRGARERAGETLSLSNIRQAAAAVHEHVSGSGGVFPLARAGERYQVNLGGSPMYWSPAASPDPRWDSAHLWPALIRPLVPWEGAAHAWTGARFDDDRIPHFVSSFAYSNSFVALPRLWTPEGAADHAIAAAVSRSSVRESEVVTPSQKAMLWDDGRPFSARRAPRLPDGSPGDTTPIAFADGHASVRHPADATPAFPNPLAPRTGTQRLHNTPGGVHGRDY